MARRVRHIHAGPNEWVRVHRARSSGEESGFGLLIFIALALMFFRGC